MLDECCWLLRYVPVVGLGFGPVPPSSRYCCRERHTGNVQLDISNPRWRTPISANVYSEGLELEIRLKQHANSRPYTYGYVDVTQPKSRREPLHTHSGDTARFCFADTVEITLVHHAPGMMQSLSLAFGLATDTISTVVSRRCNTVSFTQQPKTADTEYGGMPHSRWQCLSMVFVNIESMKTSNMLGA